MSNRPHRQFIPLCTPCLQGREWEYVKECLDTNWISSAGPFVTRFEQDLALQVGVPHAVATVNGTSALHIAMLVCGVRPNDEVIVPTLTFIASANAVRYAGAWPVFIDVESAHWQIDVALVRRFLEVQCQRREDQLINRETGRRVAALLPVHLLGHPVEVDVVCKLARQFGLTVIEDCAESLGAVYRGRPTGSWGDVGCFSFNGNKTFSSGGGGMLVTPHCDLARRARHLTTQAKSDSVEYVHDEVGYNYRLPNVLAAIGCAQLEQSKHFLERKRQIARQYRQQLPEIAGIELPQESADASSSCWLTTIRVNASVYGRSARELRDWLHDDGIESRTLWQPLHQSPAYQGCTYVGTGIAEQLYQDCLSLPSSVHLTDSELERVATRIRDGRRTTQASPDDHAMTPLMKTDIATGRAHAA